MELSFQSRLKRILKLILRFCIKWFFSWMVCILQKKGPSDRHKNILINKLMHLINWFWRDYSSTISAFNFNQTTCSALFFSGLILPTWNMLSIRPTIMGSFEMINHESVHLKMLWLRGKISYKKYPRKNVERSKWYQMSNSSK